METHVLTLLFMLVHFLLSCRFLIYSSLIFSLMGCTPILQYSIISSNGATKFLCIHSPSKRWIGFSLETICSLSLARMKDINLSNVTAEGEKCVSDWRGKKLRINFTWNCRASEQERVVSNWGNFSEEKKTFIMSNKTFSFMHKFFVNNFSIHFELPTLQFWRCRSNDSHLYLHLLARFNWFELKNSKGKFCLFTKVVRAKVTHIWETRGWWWWIWDEENCCAIWEKIICATFEEKVSFIMRIQFYSFSLQKLFLPIYSSRCHVVILQQKPKDIKIFLWGGKVFCIYS